MTSTSKGNAAEEGTEGCEPIAIIGVSSLFPQAEGLREYWSNIKRGVDSISDVPASHWNSGDYFDSDPKSQDHVYATRGGFLPDVPFNPIEFGVTPSSMEATDTSQLLGLLVAHGALVDAGYGPDRAYARDRTSVILGVTGALELTVSMGARLGHPVWREALTRAGVHPNVIEDVVKSIGDSYVAWQEDTFPGLLGNVVAGRISNRLDLGGTNCVVDAACASSLSAAHLAVLELTSGRADMAITGGVDTFNDIFMYSCFSKTLALSPTGDARPFDAGADGTILGEGVGMVVLKRLADAERDGDRIYAVVKGIGSSSDGRGKAIYAPSAEGQERALRDAYGQAGITPDTIGLVEAHGTGTKVGDATEVSALTKIYREARDSGVWCALGSVKSQIGHTKAAAGAAGMIKIALALKHKVIPPTIKVGEPNPAVDLESGPFYLPLKKRPWLKRGAHPRRAAVSALGFGGTNFHMVLEEHDGRKSEVDWDGRIQIVALSADTREDLKAKLTDISEGEFDWKELSRRATRSRRDFSSQHAFRLIQVLERDKHAPRVIFERLLEELDLRAEERFWSTREGAYFGQGKRLGKLGFLFPGQGSQYVGMCLDLACVFPQMQEALTEADVAFGDLRDVARQLSDFIYPPHVFGLDADKMNALALRATDVAQPAIGAVSVGALCILTMFGVFPAAAAGHSYGELMALFAGGRIDAPTLLHLSKLRGELMAQGEGDRGSMIAVRLPAEEAERIVAEENLDLIVANINGPQQVVLSGRSDEVERAAGIFSDRKIGATALPVAAAFHSPLVAGAQEPFREALENVRIGPATAQVYSNTTGEAYPESEDEVRTLLGGQLASPVDFVKEIESMYADGVETFVEVGPGNKMAGLVSSILGDRPHAVISIDRSSGRGDGVVDLAEALARIASLGHEIDLKPWEDGKVNGQTVELDGPAPAEAGMKVMLNGANYRREQAPPASPASSSEFQKADSMTSSPMIPDSPGQKVPVAPSSESRVPGASHQQAMTQPPRSGKASADGRGPATPPPIASAQRPSSPPTSAQHNPALAEALKTTQDSLIALQRMQQHTAELHRRFLEGQEEAQQALYRLIAQQGQLIGHATGGVPVEPSAFARSSEPTPESVATPPQHATPAELQPSGDAREHSPSAEKQGADILLGIVSEKTGYPAEMLTLEMDMESDLGIDSIKRVEILSSLQEALPHLPTIEAEELGSIRTLSDIVHFMSSFETSAPNTTVEGGNGSTTGSRSGAEDVAPGSERLTGLLLSVVAEKTGYPAEMLTLEMDMESDLGIDSIKRVEILSEMQERLPELAAPEAEELGELRTLGDVVAFLDQGALDTLESEVPVASYGKAAVSASSNEMKAAATEPSLAPDGLRELLLSVVAEKTGYPADMLNLEMDMESDLGIDSIKRVEILSELQERLPDAPVVEPDDIADIRKLQHIVDYLASAPPASGVAADVTPSPASASPGPAASNGRSGERTRKLGKQLVRLERKVLKPVLSERAGEADRIVLPEGAPILVAGPESSLRDLLVERLQAGGRNVRAISGATAREAIQETTIGGLIYVAPSPEQVGPESESTWSDDSQALLRDAFGTVQAAGSGLREAANQSGAFLTAVMRLDGCFGLVEGEGAYDPLQGGLAGLIKTARQEWDGVSCRVIDVDPNWPEDESLVEAILEECSFPGSPEVGFSAEGRQILNEVSVISDPTDADRQARVLDAGDVVLISGGARGVTAETAVALARAYQPTLVLLGRTPLPEPEPEWLSGLQDEASIKRALLEQANGSSPSPRQIEERYRRISSSREIVENLRRMEDAGARVIYRSVDIRDEGAVGSVVDEIRQSEGPIRGIVHGAGVLADRRIEEKTVEQFESVVSTKLDGLKALLSATRGDTLKLLTFFSSSTARYGRVGQVDYAMANEVLNKIAQREARRRSGCRVVSFNWGPWAGGMVTPGLEKIFAAEGVGLIPLEAGGRFLVDELERRSPDVEVIVGAPLAQGGTSVATQETLVETGPMRSAFETVINLERLPVLESHVIDGRAVLPVALMLEWFAHAALHENPGMRFQGVEELRVLNGVKLEGDLGHPIRIEVSRSRKVTDGWRVEAQLRGGDEGEVLHARCTVLLGTSPASNGIKPQRARLTERYPRLVRESYREVLFHGPALQGIDRIDGWSPEGIEAAVNCAPAPEVWMKDAPRSEWITDPLAVDCALQMLILWTYEQHGQASLPTRLGRYRQFAERFGDAVEISVRPTRTSGSLVHADIDFVGSDGSLVARIEDCEHVMDAGLIDAFTRVDPMADPIA